MTTKSIKSLCRCGHSDHWHSAHGCQFDANTLHQCDCKKFQSVRPDAMEDHPWHEHPDLDRFA